MQAKRLFAGLLSAVLLMTLLPVSASAAEYTPPALPDAFQGDGLYITATPFELEDGWYVNTTGYSNLAFGDGLIMVVRNEREVDENGYYTGATIYRAGFADKTGMVVLDFADWENPPALRDLLTGNRNFSEGLCAYYDHATGLYGYLNTQGEPVTPAIYDYANDFRDGVAWVRLPGSGCLQVINTSGQVLFEVERADNGVYSDFGDGLGVLLERRHQGVSHLVVGDHALFHVGEHGALFLGTGDDHLEGDEKILLVDGLAPHAHGAKGGFVDKVC